MWVKNLQPQRSDHAPSAPLSLPGSRSALAGRARWGQAHTQASKAKARKASFSLWSKCVKRTTPYRGQARMACAGKLMLVLACLLAKTPWLSPGSVRSAPVVKAAAAGAAGPGGSRCRLPGLQLLVQNGARGTRGRRAPGCRRAPQAPVKWWVETLSRCAVTAMRPSAPGRLQGSRLAGEGRACRGQAHTRAS